MDEISFFVPGNPKGLKRHRMTKTGHTYDPSAGDKMDFLAKAMQHKPNSPIEEPIFLKIICVFARPKNHFRTGKNAGILRDDAPFWHASTPDGDNVWKFVGDALNGIFWKDDRIIVSGSVGRVYGDVPGVAVFLRGCIPADDLLVQHQLWGVRCPS
jgi:Holliday junction resolvase RusA-like endonuclease